MLGVEAQEVWIDPAPGPPLAAWLDEVVTGKDTRHDATLVTCDAAGKCTSTTTKSAQLASVTFPPFLGAGEKNPAFVTVRFAKDEPGWPSDVAAPTSFNQKQTVSIVLGKITVPAERVEELTVYNPNDAGYPAHLEIPNLVFTVSESHAGEVYNWHQDFVVQGDNEEATEKSGAIAYADPPAAIGFTIVGKTIGLEPTATKGVRVSFPLRCVSAQFGAPPADGGAH